LLPRGATIGVVASGFAVRPRAFRAGIERLRTLGYRVELGAHVLARDGYLAGSDRARAEDLRAMITRQDVDAVWFARGGFGTTRIIERFPWREYAKRPKPLIGYSDVSGLLSTAAERTGQICLHGPLVVELGERGAFDAPSLRALLAGRGFLVRQGRRSRVVGGRARGRLLGGNLSVLAHLQGTRFAPDLRGAILLLEEVGEPVYRIDRMLTQLRLSGALDGVAGILLGEIGTVPRRKFPPDLPLERVLDDLLVPLGVPVVRGLRVGHVPRKLTLPMGGMAEVDADRGMIRFTP
jgi:muramoyltetrapeptide carboxypeptidase